MDKTDGFCEALHEIHAGNRKFIRPSTEYVRRLRDITNIFPSLDPLRSSDHPLLVFPADVDTSSILDNGQPYTKESVLRNSGIPQYERWKQLTVEHFGINALIERKEF